MLNLLMILSFILQAFNTPLTKYSFDYKIQYTYIDYVDSNRNGTIINYINSQNNSYFISIYSKKKSEPVIRFLDFAGLTYLNKTNQPEIDNNDFNFDSSKFGKYTNPYIFRRKQYDFIINNDTVLQNRVCKKITLAPNDLKQKQRHKLGKNIYMVDTSLNIKPAFVFATAYEMWKAGKVFPNGLITEKQFINYNNQLENAEVLKSIEAINFEFIVNGSFSNRFPN